MASNQRDGLRIERTGPIDTADGSDNLVSGRGQLIRARSAST